MPTIDPDFPCPFCGEIGTIEREDVPFDVVGFGRLVFYVCTTADCRARMTSDSFAILPRQPHGVAERQAQQRRATRNQA